MSEQEQHSRAVAAMSLGAPKAKEDRMPKPIEIFPAQSKADFYLPKRVARGLDEMRIRVVRPAPTKTPADAAEQVAKMPRRVAHATFAILVLQHDGNYGPHKASEIVVYDAEALSAVSTGRALAHALKLGLVDRWGTGLWSPTNHAQLLYPALEDRFYADTEPADAA